MRVFKIAVTVMSLLLPVTAHADPIDVILGLAAEDAQAIEWRGLTVDLNVVMPYYVKPNAGEVFVEGNHLSEVGEELVAALGKAADDGLDTQDYVSASFGALNRLTGEDDAAGAELALAQAYIRFARDLHAGRSTPSMSDTNIVIARKAVDPVKLLTDARSNGVETTIDTLRPRHAQYGKLRAMLKSYNSFQSLGGWDPISAGPSLKPGMVSPRVAELRASLAARGYKGLTSGNAQAFDAKLIDAVKRYQKASGIEPDAIVGKGTIQILNVPVEKRIRQIVVNMERWRWLPVDLGARHVFVNQAGFELFLVDKGQVVDNRRVIVGKPFHQTPMFSDKIGYLEFNPTWTVTPDIAGAEFLPKLQADPGYLAANDFVLYANTTDGAAEIDPYSVDWSKVSPVKFKYRIVQQPGDKNALGYVKFMFPNKRNIYLHDTPSRQLFASTGRAFSHGCIRVHDALGFAEKVMAIDQGMSRARIDQIVENRELKRVPLKTKIPIHLTYFTVWIGDDGVVQFFQDIYGRDQQVANIIYGQS